VNDKAALQSATSARRHEKLNREERDKLKNAERARKKAATNKRRKAERAAARAKAKEEQHALRVANSSSARINVAAREMAIRQLSRIHLLPFVLRMEPADYLPGWVHKDICQRLEQFEQDIRDKKSPRLMLQMPPRHGKSQLASVNFPAWYLGRNPRHEIISATYAGLLAKDFSKKVRALMREPRYKQVFPKAGLDKDSQNIDGWNTKAGGTYVPAGVDGGITGKGAHCLIIDDPVKNAEEAESSNQREAVKAWYSSTAYTRLAPGGGILIIQTRWHDDDLSGWLENRTIAGEGENWEIVRYPAVALKDEKYRKKGEALHPERYDKNALSRIELAVGPRVWDALYQQHPVAEDGTYFSKDMFKYYSGSPPALMHYYAAWDFAIGKLDRNDYTVGITVGVDREDNIWLVDLRRGRWDAFEIAEQVIGMHKEYNAMVTGVERGQLSMAIGPYLDKRIQEEKCYSLALRDMAPGKRDKESRARVIQGRMKQGKVYFPSQALWLPALREEMLKFPLAQHDDMVDALAYIGLLMQEMSPPQELKDADPWASGWRKRLKTQLTVPGRKLTTGGEFMRR
jgi:predicted phage terminase large subunit-like protein